MMKWLLKKLLASVIREVIEEESHKEQSTTFNICEGIRSEAVHQDNRPQSPHHTESQDIQNDLPQALQMSKRYLNGLLSDEQSLHQHLYTCLFLRNTHQAVRFPYQASPQIQMILEFRKCDSKEPQNAWYKHLGYGDDPYSKF